MADFELLSTYISVKTKGLEKVFADLKKVRQTAKDVQSTIKLNAPMSRAAKQTSEFRKELDKANLSLSKALTTGRSLAQQKRFLTNAQTRLNSLLAISNLTDKQKLQTQNAINRVLARRKRIEDDVNKASRSTSVDPNQQRIRDLNYLDRVRRNSARLALQQIRAIRRSELRAHAKRVQLQRYLDQVKRNSYALERKRIRDVVAFERRALARRVQANRNALARMAAARKRFQQIGQALNSASLEIGFLFPGSRVLGNLFRIGSVFANVGRQMGLTAGTATALAGALSAATLGVGALAAGFTVLVGGALRAFVSVISFALTPVRLLVRGIQSLIRYLPLLSAAFGFALVRSISKFGSEIEGLRAQFRLAFGADAQREFRNITELASRLAVPIQALAENYAKISIAARDANIAQDDVKVLFEGISTAVRALNLNGERANGIFFAFEQIISKGRLSSEELRRQLGDRLPGAFGRAARALGVTTAELDKLLEQGAISSDQFIKAIGPALRDEAAGSARELSRGLGAAIVRLSNQFQLLQFRLGSLAGPGLRDLVEQITAFVSQVRESDTFTAFAQRLGVEFGKAAILLRELAARVRGFFERNGATIREFFTNLSKFFSTQFVGAIYAVIAAFEALLPVFRRVGDVFNNLSLTLLGFDFTKFSTGIRGVREQVEFFSSAIEIAVKRAFYGITAAINDFLIDLPILGQIFEGFDELTNRSEEFKNRAAELGLELQKEFEKAVAKVAAQEELETLQKGFERVGQFAKNTFLGLFEDQDRLANALNDFQQKQGKATSIVSATELRNTIEASIDQGVQGEILKANQEAVRQNNAIRVAVEGMRDAIVDLGKEGVEGLAEGIGNVINRTQVAGL